MHPARIYVRTASIQSLYPHSWASRSTSALPEECIFKHMETSYISTLSSFTVHFSCIQSQYTNITFSQRDHTGRDNALMRLASPFGGDGYHRYEFFVETHEPITPNHFNIILFKLCVCVFFLIGFRSN